ncbi:MAG: hypothetical protein Q4D57_06020 [Clostridia bacterium]|nr:hypothetical protein [Clostridia bacterium]
MAENKKLNETGAEKVAGGSNGKMPNPNLEISIPAFSNKCIICGKELDHEWPIKDMKKSNSYCEECLDKLRKIKKGND